MELRQLFDTTITGVGVKASFRLIVLPTRSLAPTFRLALSPGASQLRGAAPPPFDLGFDGPGLVFAESDTGHEPSTYLWLLPYMLSATVHFTDISHAISYVEDVKYGRTKEPPNSDYPLLSLAERIVEDPVVPFERSPLEALSIKEIISTGSGIGIGAYLGFFAAAGSPLVFLTVPLGMVLCGGAVGFSKGLEQLVYAKMLRLMRDDE